jgi:hypothetical protein
VGSTALLINKINQIKNSKIEVVFINHGADWPETYDYLEYIQRKLEINITTINVDIEGKGGLYEYFWYYKMLPLMLYRICTVKGKLDPFYTYIKTPARILLGMTYDEKKRCIENGKTNVENVYPLVNEKITRKGAIEIIKKHGLKIPKKSGCFFCPFQKKRQWQELFYDHLELFKKAMELEERALKENSNVSTLTKTRLKDLYTQFNHQTSLSDFTSDNISYQKPGSD